MPGINSFNRTRGAPSGDGALIAVSASIVPYLQKKRSVAESGTALYAFAAGDAQHFFDDIFIVGIFHKGADNRAGWAESALRRGVAISRPRLQVSAAQITVPAHIIGMDALDRRGGEDTFSLAVSALDTHVRIDLPEGV